MAVNRAEGVRMLKEAGFVVVREEAKSTLYEKAGVTFRLGIGSTNSAKEEIRAVIRKAQRAAMREVDTRTDEMLKSLREVLTKSEATGKPIACPYCYSESGFRLNVTNRESLFRHVEANHPRIHDSFVERGTWRAVGLDDKTGKLIVPPPKKDREFWLSRSEELVESSVTHARDLIEAMNREGYSDSSGRRMNQDRIWIWFDEINLRRQARGDRPLMLAGERPKSEDAAGIAAPTELPKPVAAKAEVSVSPLDKNDSVADEEEAKLERKRIPMEERIPLWIRIARLHDHEKLGWTEIAERFNNEGLEKPSGKPHTSWSVRQSYEAYHKLRKLMTLPPPKPASTEATIPRVVIKAPEVPEYVRAVLVAEGLALSAKAAAVKAMFPKLPASVALMLEDTELSTEKKIAILGVALDG